MSVKHHSVMLDRKGRPVPPRDADWRKALKTAVIFLAVGAVLLPTGLTLYLNFQTLPASVLLAFAMTVFLGTLMLLYGITLTVMSLIGKKRELPLEERAKKAMREGIRCSATVIEVKKKKKNGRFLNVFEMTYRDKDYEYTRKFTSHPTPDEAKTGDMLTVYYLPDSNIGYYVDVSA